MAGINATFFADIRGGDLKLLDEVISLILFLFMIYD